MDRVPQEWNRNRLLFALFALYLARLQGFEPCTMLFQPRTLPQAIAGNEEVFASVVPVQIDLNPEHTFATIYAALCADLDQIEAHQSYARDLILRYPHVSPPPTTLPADHLLVTVIEHQPDAAGTGAHRTGLTLSLSATPVELGEVENALTGHQQVKEAVVASEQAHGDKQLIAYVVGEATRTVLRAYLADQLPAYMVPAHCVHMERFPLTSNGKVDRRALPKPDLHRPMLENNFVPPRTAIEHQLAELWGELLGITQVGIHDNFFAMGGHSLLTMKLVMQIENQFETKVPLMRFLTDQQLLNWQR